MPQLLILLTKVFLRSGCSIRRDSRLHLRHNRARIPVCQFPPCSFTEFLNSYTSARIFSLNLGVMFTGMAIGPAIGGLLRRTTGNALTVFYFATCVHALYALINWTILPESLSPARLRASRRRYARARADARKAAVEAGTQGAVVAVKHFVKTLFSFAEPLSVFVPVRVKHAKTPGKVGRRDWSLTLVALSYMFVIMIMASSYLFFFFNDHSLKGSD